MKFLVTGGFGFLGSHLCYEIIRRGEELFVFDNMSRVGTHQNRNWLRSKGKFKFVYGDIRSESDVTRVILDYKPDVVFHLAGQVAMTTSLEAPRLDFETNALGTFNLLESIRTHYPKAMVLYSSTNKVYGDMSSLEYQENETRYECESHPYGFDESLPFSPESPYGSSKGTADIYMRDFHKMYGIQTVVFRHSSMYGPNQFSTFDQGWVGWFCQKALEAKKNPESEFTIAGNGKQVRDVLHSSDTVDMYFTALEKIDAIAGQAFNIGGGIENSLSLLELFKLLERLTGAKLKYKITPVRKSDQKIFVADPTRISQLTGWRPKTKSEDGIQKMLQWLESNDG